MSQARIPQPTTELSFDELRYVLNLTLRAGELLLQHGADTHRVEETIDRMGMALGAADMDVYVTPTGIIVGATNGWEQHTRIRRVNVGSVDLSRIDAINRLSRRIRSDNLSAADVDAELDQIAALPRNYNRPITTVMVALACASFSQLFGGGAAEFLATLISSSAALLTRQWLLNKGVGPLLQVTPAAFIASICGILIGWPLDVSRVDVVVPAAVLPLVPGVPLINALTDLLASDYVSGVTRGAQALLIAAEIAVGVALALNLLRLIGLDG